MNMLLPSEKLKRTVLVRKEAETSPKYGCDPNKRPIATLVQYGVINIDKPQGPTSHQVSSYVQNILKLSKSGHSGTLDPKVTGLLPVAVGRATKVVQALLIAGKEYVAVMHLHKPISEKEIQDGMMKFVGRIKQLPPVKSSVKRQWRHRTVYYLDIMEIDGQDVLFSVGCQAGTYIRKLIHDMGIALGTKAHMVELRRTKAGPFDESTLCTLQDIHDAYWYYTEQGNEKFISHIIQPPEHAVMHLPKVWVFDTTVNTLCHGADLKVPGISKVESDIQVGEMIAIMTLKNELVALGTTTLISKDMEKLEHGIAVKTEKVFMEPGTYPKMEKPV